MTSVIRLVALLLCAMLVLTTTAFAQSSTGTITGRILDTSGKSVPGATVILTKSDTRERRNLTTAISGDFVFTALQPGPYNLRVEAKGFNVLEKTGLLLTSSERLSAGDLVLQVGQVAEVVVVTADATPVQTTSSERSAVVDSVQVTNLTTRGRDVFGLLATLPGVVYDGRGNDGLGTQNSPSAFSGARGIYSAANIDGISGNTRSGNSIETPVNMDTVAEVKVLIEQLPGRIRQGRGGRNQPGHQERQPGVSRSGLLLPAQRGVQRERLLQPTVRTARRAAGIASTRSAGTSAARFSFPGRFNKAQETSCSSSSRTSISRAPSPRTRVLHRAHARGAERRFYPVGGSPQNGSLYAASRVVDPFNKNASGVAQPFPNGIVPASRIDPQHAKAAQRLSRAERAERAERRCLLAQRHLVQLLDSERLAAGRAARIACARITTSPTIGGCSSVEPTRVRTTRDPTARSTVMRG